MPRIIGRLRRNGVLRVKPPKSRLRRLRLEHLESRTLLAADLSITKTAESSSVNAGEQIVYDIHVHNFGPDSATNTVVTDTLPDGLQYLSNTNAGGCVQVGSTLSCDLGNVSSGDNRDFQIQLLVPPDFLVTKDTNANEVQTVTLSGGVAADTFTLTFLGQTTAAIAQTADGPAVQAKLEGLSNINPGDVAVTGAAGGPYTITFGGALAAQNVPQLTGAGTGALVVTVATTTQGNHGDDGSFVLSNTATVSSTNAAADPDLSDNTSTENTFVTELADLIVTKFVEPTNTVRAGETFGYTIWVDNLGPSAARKVTIKDTMLSSDSVTVQSCAFSVSQGGGAITQFTCTTGNLVSTQFGSDIGTFSTNLLMPFGQVPDPMDPTAIIPGRLRASFRLKVTDSEGGAFDTHGGNTTVTNTTRVSSPTPDPVTSNNASIADITITPVSDLQMFAVFGAEVHVAGQPSTIINTNALPPLPETPFYNFGGTTVTAGRRISWQSTVFNAGPSSAENVRQEILLPFGTQLIENTLTTQVSPPPPFATGRCYTEPAGEIRKKVICQYGTLKTGETGSVTFQLLTDINLPAGTQLSIDAIADSDNFDPNNANNIADIQFDTNVDQTAIGLTKPDLTITKDAPTTAEPGQEITFKIHVNNAGLVNAPDVVVQDFLPAGLRGVSYASSIGNCLAGVPGDALRPTVCNIGLLGPGKSADITVEAIVGNDVKDLTRLFNDVTVGTSGDERDPTNNVFHSTTLVLQTAGGNVTANVKKGTLNITGDKFNNKLRIEDASAADPGAFRITPLGGTQVNGSFDSFQVHGVRFSVVSFGMGAGNDTLLFAGPLTLPKNLIVSLGQGDDRLELTDATVQGSVSIKADGGNDTVVFTDSLIVGRLDLAMGVGDDHITMTDSTVQGNASILADGGADTISLVDSFFAGKLDLRTGTGNDTVTIDGTTVKKAASIKNDGNDDVVTVLDSIFGDSLSFIGGNGLDTLDANAVTRNNSFAKTPTIKGFENILP